MADYQIFADATCGLTPELTEGLPSIEQVSMQVEIGGRNYTCGPDGDLTTKEFYALQRQGNFASTTQIAPGAFLDYFEPVLKAGRDLSAEIAPVIGSHTGPGMLAIIYWGSNR